MKRSATLTWDQLRVGLVVVLALGIVAVAIYKLGQAANLFAKDFFLKMIFVANVNNAALCAGDDAGDEHAFDDEMRQMRHDEAVLDCPGLAFIGVADDVFRRARMVAEALPLGAGGEPRAAATPPTMWVAAAPKTLALSTVANAQVIRP